MFDQQNTSWPIRLEYKNSVVRMGLEADWHWRLCCGVQSFKLQTWQVFNGRKHFKCWWAWLRDPIDTSMPNFVLCSCCHHSEFVICLQHRTYIYRIIQVNMVFHGYTWYFTQTSDISHQLISVWFLWNTGARYTSNSISCSLQHDEAYNMVKQGI